MARPRKPVNYEEELQRIEQLIQKHTKTLEKLQLQKKELQKRTEQEELTQLYQLFKDSGLTPQEFLSTVTEKTSGIA